jgi:sulfofructose kinase
MKRDGRGARGAGPAGFDVVGVGSACIDLVVQVPRLPVSDEGLQIQEYTMQGGGKVATALVAAARLGLRAAFSGPVGGDAFGQQILAEFTSEGVDTAGLLVQRDRASAFSTVLADVSTGTRSILWSPGTVTEIALTASDLRRIESARYLLVSEPSPTALQAATHASAHGVPVVCDADYYSPEINRLLPLVDICIASAHFVRAFAPGRSPEEALDPFPSPTALITLGKDGVVGRGPDGPFRIPAFQVPVVDTTGAGDVFHGAFIAGLVHGYGLAHTARYASAVAAMKCTALGGRRGIPTHQDALEFLARQKISEV